MSEEKQARLVKWAAAITIIAAGLSIFNVEFPASLQEQILTILTWFYN